MKKNLKIYASTIILLVTFFTSPAQESTSLFFMKGMPQSTMYNPALHNDSSTIVIGLPGLSGVYFDINGDFAYNDLIHYGTGNMADSLIVDIDGFHSKLKDQNYFRQNFSMNLFHLGFRTSKVFFDFSISEKQTTNIGFGKGFISFLKEGNGDYMGQTQDLGDVDLDFYHYREFALGASTDVLGERLSLGAKVKALYGKFALQTDQLNFKVNTAADGSSVTLNTDMKVNFASPMLTPEYDESNFLNGFEEDFSFSDYILSSENMGIAFDLGMVFKATEKLTLMASIIDIGQISFTADSYNIRMRDSYDWQGLDFSNTLDDTDPNYISADDMIDQEMDKLEAVVKPQQEDITAGSFDLALPSKIFLGGNYILSDKVDIGILDRIYTYDGQTQNTLTVSANAMLGNFLSLTGTYSAIGNKYDNLGIGVALRGGPFQFYMVNDNILALTNPAKARFVNVRFGLNILFGRQYDRFVYDEIIP